MYKSYIINHVISYIFYILNHIICHIKTISSSTRLPYKKDGRGFK